MRDGVTVVSSRSGREDLGSNPSPAARFCYNVIMFYEIIGWLGTGAILFAYFLVSTRKIAPNSKAYQLLNLFGAFGVIINSAIHHAIPSVGLNIVWLLIAAYGLLKLVK